MEKTNKGFTLVELIISFALLSIVSAVVVGFIGSGTNTYRTVSSEVKLQYESQIALAQLREYLIDCNGGVCFDSATDTLYVLSASTPSGGTTAYTAHTFQLIGDGIYYDTQPVSLTIDGSVNYYTIDSASYDPDLMASSVTGFDVHFESYSDPASNLIATRAEVAIDFSSGGRDYTGAQDISFRNKVLTSGTFNATALLVLTSTP